MRNVALAVIFCFVVAGCASEAELEAERRSEQAEVEAEDNLKCVNFGFERGTQNYFQCRMQIEQNRESAAAERRALALQYYMMKRSQSAPAATPAPTLGQRSTTNCYLIGNTMNCTTR
jgi:hypothetical protein